RGGGRGRHRRARHVRPRRRRARRANGSAAPSCRGDRAAGAAGRLRRIRVAGHVSLLASNLVVAAGTACSRVSGLARTFVFVYVIGQTALADAYLLANETPNIVYDLLLGGVLSATLVPLFTQLMQSDAGGDGERDTNVVITVAITLMAVLTAVAMLAAPLIFRLYNLNPSEGVDVALFRQVGTTLTRIFLLQILFYGLTGVANAYLNSRRR